MTNNDNLTGFEARLLTELRVEVQRRAEFDEIVAPALAPNPWRRRALVLGSAAAVAAAVAIVVPAVTGGPGASKAYAVTRDDDGTVTVTVYRFDDAAGLQSQLKAKGVNAVVDYTPAGKTCKMPRYTPVQAGGWGIQGSSQHGGTTSFTVRPSDYTGHTLVITNSDLAPTQVPGGSGTEAAASSVQIGVADGPVAPCELVDATDVAPPPGGGFVTHQEVPGEGPTTSTTGPN